MDIRSLTVPSSPIETCISSLSEAPSLISGLRLLAQGTLCFVAGVSVVLRVVVSDFLQQEMPQQRLRILMGPRSSSIHWPRGERTSSVARSVSVHQRARDQSGSLGVLEQTSAQPQNDMYFKVISHLTFYMGPRAGRLHEVVIGSNTDCGGVMLTSPAGTPSSRMGGLTDAAESKRLCLNN